MLYIRNLRRGLGGPDPGQCAPCSALQACVANNVRTTTFTINLVTTLGNNLFSAITYTFLGATVGRGAAACSTLTAPFLTFLGTSSGFRVRVDPWGALGQGAWTSSTVVEVRAAMRYPYGPTADDGVLSVRIEQVGAPALGTKAGKLPYQPSDCPSQIFAHVTFVDDGTLIVT